MALPFIEKYRPQNFEELILSKEKQNILLKFFSGKDFPNLLFFGPPGVGKTSTILTCAKKLYGKDAKFMVLELNASNERGIEVVRNKIKEFTTTKLGIVENIARDIPKLIILDEVDSISSNAQSALLIEMEKRMKNARFCLICNYVHKLSIAIQSRCMKFKFSPLNNIQIKTRLSDVLEKENLQLTNDGLEALTKISKGDLRKSLNILQQIAINKDIISEEYIYKITGHPLPTDIEYIFETLTSHKSIQQQYNLLHKFKKEKCLDLYEILTQLHTILLNKIISGDFDLNYNKFFDKLGKLEEALCKGADQEIQLSVLISIFTLNRGVNSP